MQSHSTVIPAQVLLWATGLHQYAMDALKAGRSDDEELICIVENDACG